MGIQEYIESKGFVAHRKIYCKEKKQFEYILSTKKDFSTMVSGGLDIRYLKDGIEIIYGLNEHGLPPTIIYPIPNIKGGWSMSEQNRTVRALNKYSCEEFFNALFDKSIILYLD